MRKGLTVLGVIVVLNFLIISQAHASSFGSGLIWEDILSAIADSIKGPVATSICIIAAVWAGVTMMFGELTRSVRWVVGVILGFAISTSILGILNILGVTTALM